MKTSYDYEELLQEFKVELEDGILTADSEVQILRASETLKPAFHFGKIFYADYKPVIDWFYDERAEQEQMSEYSDEEKSYYLSVKKDLETTTVSALVAEMEEMNKLY